MASFQAYDQLLYGILKEYCDYSNSIGDLVKDQAVTVRAAFQAQLEFLRHVASHPKPKDDELEALLKPTATGIKQVQKLCEDNRKSNFFNHLSAVKEGIAILGWVLVTPDPTKYGRELHGAAAYFANKVMAEHKDKCDEHFKWAKAWLDVMGELVKIIKEHYVTGLNWNVSLARGCAPPPPPPPPLIEDFQNMSMKDSSNVSDARSALLQDLNKGADITKCLKKVSSRPTQNKEYTLEAPGVKQKAQPSKLKPVFQLDGRKWIVENQEGRQDLKIDNAEMNQTVYIYKCKDCCINVTGKVNCITIDTSKSVGLVCHDVVSSLEVLNSQKTRVQANGTAPTIVIDKCDNAMVYLSEKSLDTEIISSMSTGLNVSIPKDSDYIEWPVPEQFKSTFINGKLVTQTVEKQ